MSRSSRAWAKGCELVGAAVRGVRRLGKLEVRESLEAERLVRTGSSLATLTWVATAVMLMLALTPALALGKSASRSSRAPAARAAQATSHARVTRTEQSSDPPQWRDGYPQTYRARERTRVRQRLRKRSRLPGRPGTAATPDGVGLLARANRWPLRPVDRCSRNPLPGRAWPGRRRDRWTIDDGSSGLGQVAPIPRGRLRAGWIGPGAGVAAPPGRGRIPTGADRRTVRPVDRASGDSVPDRSPPPRRRHRRPTNAGPASTRNATAGSRAAASTEFAASGPPPPRPSRRSTKPVSPHEPAPVRKPGSTHKLASSPPRPDTTRDRRPALR